MTLEDVKDDWRMTGQEEYLMDAVLTRTVYSGEDHEHCEFCWHKFMKEPVGVSDCSSEGYTAEDGSIWICDKCFADFREPFRWSVK